MTNTTSGSDPVTNGTNPTSSSSEPTTDPTIESRTQGKRGKYIVTIDRAKCISIGNCVAFAPDVFALDDESIAVMQPVPTDQSPLVSDDETVLMAARSCPTQAIIIKDAATGEQVFP
ncbi:ferredoxin [Candidatus Gracilibacteria bacterium]|nr:ferredoxin [Candidatus Gracilibacteria bacterium]